MGLIQRLKCFQIPRFNQGPFKRKISTKKYLLKLNNKELVPLANIYQLEDKLKEFSIENVPNNQVSSIPSDKAIVSGYEIDGTEFSSFITTKNLIMNIVKQTAATGNTLICVDGTYKLNSKGYPTIVVGTCDILRKFRLSNFILLY